MTKVINLGQYPFPDAESGQVYPPQTPTEPGEVTGWLKSQVDAGSFKWEEGAAEEGAAEEGAADEPAQAEADRVAAETVQSEADRVAAETVQSEADRVAAEKVSDRSTKKK